MVNKQSQVAGLALLMSVTHAASAFEPESVDTETLPKVTVEADSATEVDPYDPSDTKHPYNISYSVSNSSRTTKTDTPMMEMPASIAVVAKSVLRDQKAYRLQGAIKTSAAYKPGMVYSSRSPLLPLNSSQLRSSFHD